MKIDFSDAEVKRIVKTLHEKYIKSINLYEIMELKNILEKLGETVEDWTGDFAGM